jgi:2-dehydro-3-deoxygalactonokinase
MSSDTEAFDAGRFMQGLECAMQATSILHATFTARTLSLFDRMPAHAAPSYLSGLLIGEELRAQDLHAAGALALAGAEKLVAPYGLALSHLGVPFRTYGQEATWLGLHTIAQSLEKTR